MLGSCVDFGPGLLHWYGLYPVHSLVFAGMLKGIASAAAMRTDATKGRYRRAPAHRARARRSSWSALTRPERSASPVGTPAPSLGHPGRRSRSTFPAKPASPAGYPAGRAPRCGESAGMSFLHGVGIGRPPGRPVPAPLAGPSRGRSRGSPGRRRGPPARSNASK